jgi:5-methyltetrahydropteroyltriglutamate--homocysteine methyltransferase
MLLPTCLVGSYPQPEWLIDREKLSKQVPRVRADDLWLVSPDKLEAAQDDATILAIRDQERAGLDIITDGEQRRESYSNRFATALDGIDIDNPGTVINRNGRPIPVPRIVSPIRRRQPVELRDLKVLRANTERKIKATVLGPFTMGRQAHDDYYGDEEAVAMAYAEAVNAEIKDLFAAGADVVQIDEPWMQQHPERAVTASRRSTARSTALPRRSSCICASAMPRWCAISRRAIPSCRNWSNPKRNRFRSRRRSRNSTSKFSANCRPRPSCSA